MTGMENEVLEYLGKHPEEYMTIAEVAAGADRSYVATGYALRMLVARNAIETKQINTRTRLYRICPATEAS